VLNPEVMDEVEHIVTWLRQPQHILRQWGLEKSVKPGYRSLFYGPPGTGKTLTASLIGKAVGADVYRIDLSMVVSATSARPRKPRQRVRPGAEQELDPVLRRGRLAVRQAHADQQPTTATPIRKFPTCCNGWKTFRAW
jgi:SpoVK/Ycf46/Vps4 family AAA+-type ATPase